MLRTLCKISLIAVAMTLVSVGLSSNANAGHPGHHHMHGNHYHNSGNYVQRYNPGYSRSGIQISVNRPFLGGIGSFGFSSGPTYHDTTHYDYIPGGYVRHHNHYDYVPGRTVLHPSGHYHW
jgi:hypothetical protein